MTTEQIMLLIAEIALLIAEIVIEIQIIMLKKDLLRETIVRRSGMRTIKNCFRRLWVDIRAAGIKRADKEEASENDGE